MGASFLGDMLLFFVIHSDEKLQVHPMKLFATVAFLDGALNWLFFMEPTTCSINKTNLFYAITFPNTLNATLQEQYY